MDDFLDELGELALGSRLKRLSERMMTEATSVYQHFDFCVQPKWFTLLALLAEKETVGVVQASESLGLTQPAISQFSRQLEAENLIIIKKSDTDSRKKLMQLTKEGKQQIKAMQPVWEAVDKAAKELCNEFENDFYNALLKFERSLALRSLKDRTLDNYKG